MTNDSDYIYILDTFLKIKYDNALKNEDTISKKKEVLENCINDFCLANPEIFEHLNYDSIKKELDKFLSGFQNGNLFVKKGFEPWLDDYVVKNEISYDYYHRYERYLLLCKKWNYSSTISSIDYSSKEILEHCGCPTDDAFKVKGLVMGDIQSGKTANYTAVINKAIDLGYKLIIVLSGMTKDLRYQTQKRLQYEVLGYETSDANQQRGKNCGVGLINELPYVATKTFLDLNGDLKTPTSASLLSQDMNPTLLIVKKNQKVLDNVIKMISEDPYVKNSNNQKLMVPTLIIDDEVDQGSINTKKEIEIENSTRINGQIRSILKILEKYTYIGYSATPFANVFISPTNELPEEDKDLFPKDFVYVLKTPEDYSGINEYFSKDNDHYDLFEETDDFNEVFDYIEKIDKDTNSTNISTSLERAFMFFIIGSAIKRQRGFAEHNTMLIHLTHFKNPSNTLKPLVDQEISDMRNKFFYGGEKYIKVYKEFWVKNIKSTSEKRLGDDFDDNWIKIEKQIENVFNSLINNIVVINGDSGDNLDYSGTYGEYIVIGGNKLSRGLTLEGLLVSYYDRNAKTYDTLLQMGRWFGYKQGWLDLCRIFTTVDIVDNFISIGDSLEEFKHSINNMNDKKLTPEEFGLLIRCSSNLLPTAKNKMRHAKKIKVSYSGSTSQTTDFSTKNNRNNILVLNEFINKLKNATITKRNKIVFRNVDSSTLIDFLSKYKEPKENNVDQKVVNWVSYIKKANECGELINWTIVINSNKTPTEEDMIGSFKVNKPRRHIRTANYQDDTKRTRVITDPSDFAEFFDENSKEYEFYSKNTYGSNNITLDIASLFNNKNGLLSVYNLDLYSRENKDFANKKDIILSSAIGLGIWFPSSDNLEKTLSDYYYANEIYLKGGNIYD